MGIPIRDEVEERRRLARIELEKRKNERLAFEMASLGEAELKEIVGSEKEEVEESPFSSIWGASRGGR